MPFSLPKPVNFAAVAMRPAADVVPSPLVRRARQRVANLREAAEVLAVLPVLGEALHALMTGRYDLTDLLAALIDRFGPCRMKVATLSFNQGNTVDLIGWLDAGKVQTLDLLCSAFFRDHNAELFRAFRVELYQRGGRLAAARNHAKVVTPAFDTGERFALEGSANLRTNSNQEQFCLAHDAALHDWHAAWISDRVTQHEGNASPN